MDPVEVQANLLRQFSERAAKLMPSQGRPPLAVVPAIAALVIDATSHPEVFDFSSLLCLPAISSLRDTQYYWHLDALGIFAYGTLKDYKRHKDILPALKPKQLVKLKDVTLLTAFEARQLIPIDDLMEELDFKSVEELTAYLHQAYKRLGFSGRLSDDTLEVTHAPQIHGRPSYGQSLEVYLQAATVCHVDAQTGILSNEIATQVKIPVSRCGRSFCYKVDFKPRGSEIFVQLIGLTSDGHFSRRSWNGLIYPGMFGILNGQLFLLPGAAARFLITDKNSQKDYDSVDNMFGCYSGIKFPHRGKCGTMKEVMYPIYVDNLRSHLKGMKPRLSQNPIRALDVKLITFYKCHPSLLTTSARSVVCFHVRKEYKSVDASTRGGFSVAIRSANPGRRWWTRLESHWLFRSVFQYARSHGCLYKNNATDCHRCIRDWETHGREHLSDHEKRIFTTVVLTYLVEHYFDDFFPEIMYNLLCGPQITEFDLKDWLSKLQRLAPNDEQNAVAVQGHQGVN